MSRIHLEVSRWTIMKLEEAIQKYNTENKSFRISDYEEVINRILESYLKSKKAVEERA